MATKFRFLFAPFDGGIGHTNVCIGIGQQLLQRGHEVHIVVPVNWNGALEKLGFQEHCIWQEPEDDSVEMWTVRANYLLRVAAMTPFEKLENFALPFLKKMVQDVKKRDGAYREIMAKIKPDVVIEDMTIQNPALVNNGVPYVFASSTNTMTIAPENVPPAHQGYPVKNGNKTTWKAHAEKEKEVLKDIFEDFTSWLSQNGGPSLTYKPLPFWREFSPYANLYMFPEALSYTTVRPDPPNWYRVDTFMRSEEGRYELPNNLGNLPGKWIYFSMGTVGCYDLTLMRRLIGILAESPNRFIVSKGPLGDELELAPNMSGAANLPQTQVLPLVDLVITHAGHNTVSECFYFGKKVLILPLVLDHLDNAQRIDELELGKRFDPLKVSKEELLCGIEDLIENADLQKKLDAISKQSQAARPQEQAADIIENVAKAEAERKLAPK